MSDITIRAEKEGVFISAGADNTVFIQDGNLIAVAKALLFHAVPSSTTIAVTTCEESAADPTAHASTSPGPVNCSTRLRHQKAAYPRTCVRCGLGPCPFFNNDGSAKP